MKFSDRIDAVTQAYQRLLGLYQPMGENTRLQGELFESALQQLNVVLEELRTGL